VKGWARKGTAHQLLKEYHKAMDAFAKGTSIEPGNKECKEGTQKTMMLI
jgi:stress-induced-phosphoprotein 1